MTTRSSSLAGLFLALTLVLTACATDPTSSEDPAATHFVVDDNTPELVEGEDFELVETLPRTDGNDSTTLRAVTDDGTQTFVRESVDPENADHLGAPPISTLLVRISGDQVMPEVPPNGPVERKARISEVTTSGNTIVWVEDFGSHVGIDGWELHSYDLNTGVEKSLFSSKSLEQKGPRTMLAGATPVIAGDQVVFVIADEPRNEEDIESSGSSVYRVPLIGGDPELVAKNAFEVFADRDGLVQLRFPDRLVAWDPAKGVDGEVAGTNVAVSGNAFANEGVRVFTNDDKHVQIMKTDGSGVTVEVLGEPVVTYLNATGRWGGFGTSLDGETQDYVFDIDRNVVLALKETDHLSWNRMHGSMFGTCSYSDTGSPTSCRLLRLLPKR